MATSFLAGVNASPSIRPQFNIGSLFDQQTGSYEYGKHGEAILNGGLAHITGICGRGNSFKTVIMLYMFLTVLDRYLSSGMVYDTEISLTVKRLQGLSKKMVNHLLGVNFMPSDKFVLTDKSKYNGTEWFEWLKEVTEFRQKMHKADMAITPFIDSVSKHIEMLIPFMVGVDSLSEFTTASVIKQQNDGSIGESDMNTIALRDANAKTQLIRELATLCENNGVYFLTTMHMGDQHQLDPYAPPAKKLAFMKGKITLKNVPEKASFLLNNIWHVMGSAVLQNPKTKLVEFPRDSKDDLKGDTDLMVLSVTNLRGKAGTSGFPFDLVVSQKEGLEVELTDMYYLLNYGRFGLGGNDKSYFLELYPDLLLSRSTVRGKLKKDPLAARALEITSRLLQMINYRCDDAEDIMCTPKELRDDLIAMGYDWNVLLATRTWWTFNNDKHPVPYLETLDLLRMRAGLYVPYWYKKAG